MIRIFSECFAETVFINYFVKLNNLNIGVQHEFGISLVAKALEKVSNIDIKSIGWIDNDKKNIPIYFNNFEIVFESKNYILKKHFSKNQILICVKPAIEKFLITLLKDLDYDLNEYQFTENFKKFRSITKKKSIEDNKNYEKLIKKIILSENKTILEITKLLKNENY